MPLQFEILDYQQLREDLDWWMIYYYCFPREERESELVILKSVSIGAGMAFSVKEGNITKGIATVHLLKDIPAVFLVYLAIIPSERCKGIGSKFFRFIEESATKQLESVGIKSAGMVWEIQKSESTLSGETSEKDQRKAFFEKNGGSILPCKYIQPPVDGKNLVEMHLMFKPKEGSQISASDLIKAVYYDKYQRINEINKKTLDKLFRSLNKTQ